MKVIIRGIEVYPETIQELEQLVKKFGQDSKVKNIQKQADIVFQEGKENGESKEDKGEFQTGATRDITLLRRFCEVYRQGLPSKELQMRLQANQKMLRKALEEWARRIGLWTTNFESTFFRGIYNKQRGYRLEKEAYKVGKDILEHKG